MSTYAKAKLSGSTSGKPIKVAQTAIATGDTIHVAAAGAVDLDEVTLFVTNTTTVAKKLTVSWGSTTDPDGLVMKDVSIPANSGPIPIVSGLILNGGLSILAAAETANVLLISGYVNQIR